MIDMPTEESPKLSPCINCMTPTPLQEYLDLDHWCLRCHTEWVERISTQEYPEPDPQD